MLQEGEYRRLTHIQWVQQCMCVLPHGGQKRSEECRGKKRIQHLSEEHSRVLVLCVPALLLLLSTAVLLSSAFLPAAITLASQELKFCVIRLVSITVRPDPCPGFLGLVIMLLV